MPKTTYYRKLQRAERIKPSERLTLFFDLISSFGLSKNPIDTANFLQDLLTANEITNLAVRLRIAKLLLAGKSYVEIKNETRTSSATITKVSMWLQEKGEGFRKVISKLPTKYQVLLKIPSGPLEFHLPQILLATFEQSQLGRKKSLVEKFSENVNEKRSKDKQLKEQFREFYFKRKPKNNTSSI
ncbi:MAG: TrpR like protein, YerC/YecD [Candidatus Woesebacteria bacterium GW2011_GWB1_39_10]|uniref:TrpR like protein, YerC/YecD n=3 Tax=Candidatus Woeseibacteriota TaxID=1752722 RepID=A0A0G0LJ48_9BACT|nr:MAG: TrpR like protein, YerC/YecD [Candidatus Woesebacteria bacterium GW2011_GWB1_39_10]KKS90929.1 MAG: TrpR like protein, YerC/YecD [Candidatus Woesebacteria bacterium GW2011_GWA1_43_12]